MSTAKVKEAAEAICGALHRTEFRWLGDSDTGASSWFTRGEKPKIVRIEVVRSDLAPMVLVNIEWPNVTKINQGVVEVGRITIQVDCKGSEIDTFMACEKAVVRCLEVFRDVLSGEGVASAAAVRPTETPERSSGDDD